MRKRGSHWRLMPLIIIMSSLFFLVGDLFAEVSEKKEGLDNFIEQWIKFLKEHELKDAVVTVEIDKLTEKLKNQIPPGCPMPEPVIYWKAPDRATYKLLLPGASPEMEMMLQSSGMDAELSGIVKSFKVLQTLSQVISDVFTEKKAREILKIKKPNEKKIVFKKLKDGGYLLRIINKTGAKDAYQYIFSDKLLVTKYEMRKGEAQKSKADIQWQQVKNGDTGKKIPFLKKVIIARDEGGKTVDYVFDFKDVKLNMGFDDAVFEKGH